jgi:hypothetical protein
VIRRPQVAHLDADVLHHYVAVVAAGQLCLAVLPSVHGGCRGWWLGTARGVAQQSDLEMAQSDNDEPRSEIDAGTALTRAKQGAQGL